MFFATPHRGSDLAFWDDIGTTLVRISTLGHSTNTKLSRDLRVNGILLKSISDSFVHRGGRFKIRSFYETQQMQNLHCEVSNDFLVVCREIKLTMFIKRWSERTLLYWDGQMNLP